MKRLLLWAKKISLALLALLVLAQFAPVSRRNPQTDADKSIYAKEKMPTSVKLVFERSCANCHSNNTAWPWYSHVAPVSWMIASDVHDARAKLNFSEWGDYQANTREEKLEDICEQISNGEMPDFKYLLVHRSARLTQTERDAVCRWTEDSRQY